MISTAYCTLFIVFQVVSLYFVCKCLFAMLGLSIDNVIRSSDHKGVLYTTIRPTTLNNLKLRHYTQCRNRPYVAVAATITTTMNNNLLQ